MAEQNQQLARISEKTVAPFIAPKEHELINLIGRENMIRETSFAIQAANSNDYLAQATPQSVAKGVWNVAISNLSLNPVMKLAYLVPKRINNIWEAILMPSYMGLCKLITDTGAVINIYAHVVYNGDDYEVEYGTETKLRHAPRFKSSKKEDVIFVYAVAVLHDGSKMFEAMSLEQVHEIRQRSDGYRAWKDGKAKSCIWESDFGEMARKTAVKRLAKYLPKTDVKKWEKVMTAIDMDNAEYPASEQQINFANRLLDTSTFDERQRGHVKRILGNDPTQYETEKIINDLKLNQLDPVDRSNYSVTEAKDKVADTIQDQTAAA